MRYGMLMYDVPIDRQSAYNKLRKALKGTAIMSTWSCYFFPWADRDMLLRVIEDLNDDDNRKITFNVLLFDESEEEKLAQMVVDGIQRLMANARNAVAKAILKAEGELAKGEAQLIDLRQAIAHSHGEAKKVLKDATSLALRFEQSNNLTDAIASYTRTIEAIVAERNENYARLLREENERASAKAQAQAAAAAAAV
jgi:hypothetical protein